MACSVLQDATCFTARLQHALSCRQQDGPLHENLTPHWHLLLAQQAAMAAAAAEIFTPHLPLQLAQQATASAAAAAEIFTPHLPLLLAQRQQQQLLRQRLRLKSRDLQP